MSSQPRTDRLPVGQLLTNLLRVFRTELTVRIEGSPAVAGLRPAHLPIFGTIKADGSRLTDLANRADLSLSAAAELIDDLQAKGYVERRPDPSDRRAKLVCLTDRGWEAMRAAREAIASIEAEWGSRLGDRRYSELTAELQALLDELDPAVRRGYKVPPEREA